MRRKWIIVLAAVCAVLVTVSVGIFRKSAGSVAATTEVTTKETEISSVDIKTEIIFDTVKDKAEKPENESQTKFNEDAEKETVAAETDGANERGTETTTGNRTEFSAETEDQSLEISGNSQTAESDIAELPSETEENNDDNGIRESTSERTSEEESASLDVSGDSWANCYYPFDEDFFQPIIFFLSNPQWYQNEDQELTMDCYNRVYALSDRYRREHPFSEGSILKPLFPNIDSVESFCSDFEEREVVLKAYDALGTKKFFLINFTITDDEKLDTVTIRELADNEVIE